LVGVSGLGGESIGVRMRIEPESGGKPESGVEPLFAGSLRINRTPN